MTEKGTILEIAIARLEGGFEEVKACVNNHMDSLMRKVTVEVNCCVLSVGLDAHKYQNKDDKENTS